MYLSSTFPVVWYSNNDFEWLMINYVGAWVTNIIAPACMHILCNALGYDEPITVSLKIKKLCRLLFSFNKTKASVLLLGF